MPIHHNPLEGCMHRGHLISLHGADDGTTVCDEYKHFDFFQ